MKSHTKKTLLIITISIFFVLLFLITKILFVSSLNLGRPAPDKITEDWQTLVISGIGSFRVPSEWYVDEDDDGILFLTDRPRTDDYYIIHMVGRRCGYCALLYEVFDEVIERHTLLRSWSNSWFFDLDGIVSLWEYTVNNIKQEHFSVSLSGASRYSYRLFGWNREVVDEWLADQIGRTVVMTRADDDHPNLGRLCRD